MKDIRTMTGSELLDWFAQHPAFTPSLLSMCLAAGISNLDTLAPFEAAARDLADQMETWADHRTASTEPLTPEDLPRLLKMGWKPLIGPRADAAEWEKFFDQLDPYEVEWIDDLIDAGRTPAEGLEMFRLTQAATLPASTFGPATTVDELRSAIAYGAQSVEEFETLRRTDLDEATLTEIGAVANQYGLPINAFGLRDMTASEFARLANLGYRSDEERADYASAAGSFELADQLRAAGVPFTVLGAVLRYPLASSELLETLPKMPEKWFVRRRYSSGKEPYSHGRPALDLGYTWDDLRYLVDNGWSGVEVESLAAVGPAGARYLVTKHMDADEYVAWFGALWSTRKTYNAPQQIIRQLDRQYVTFRGQETRICSAVVEIGGKLRAIGVRPAAVVEYRWSGADSVSLIAKAVDLGIDNGRVRDLRAAFGKRRGSRRPKSINTFEELVRLHQENISAITTGRSRAST